MYSAEEINGCRPDSRVRLTVNAFLMKVNVWFDIRVWGRRNNGTLKSTQQKSQCTCIDTCIAVYRMMDIDSV